MESLFNAYNRNAPRTVQNASDLLPIPSYWQEYPDRDIEYVRWYPPLMGIIDENDIWASRNVPEKLADWQRRAAFYLHIPFCNQSCESCMYSKYRTQGDRYLSYIDALKKEIDTYAAKPYVQELEFLGGYFGGGTPTAFKAAYLRDLLRHLHGRLNISPRAVITVETTPFEMNEYKAEALLAEGATRISIGVQSFNEDHLRLLGRKHGAREVVDCVRLLRKTGFTNINVDLMFGLAGEGLESWRETIDAFIDLGADSVSLYSFLLVPFSNLFQKILSGSAPPTPAEDEKDAMARYAVEKLLTSGFAACSSRDFARKSFIRQGLNGGSAPLFPLGPDGREGVAIPAVPQLIYPALVWYWNADQLPLGAGSLGKMNGYVYANDPGLDDYIERCNSGGTSAIMGAYVPQEEKEAMAMVLGTKLLKVYRGDFRLRFGADMAERFGPRIARLVDQGLATLDAEAFTVTYPKGFDYTDNISKAFYTSRQYRVPQPNIDNTRWLRWVRKDLRREVVHAC